MKTTITRSEYLQLLGLRLLAQRANSELYRLIDAAGAIIGEDEPRRGHIGDTFWGDESDDVDTMLRKMKVTVEADK